MRERVSRRSFLHKVAIGGGGLLIFAAGGLAWRAWDRGALGKIYEGPAFDPWEDWRNNRFEGPLGLVSAAILASNPHNSQPWLFRVDEQRIDLYANPARSLRSIDPFQREMYIGLGCALENLMVVCDDFNLPLGKLRIRARGTHGGHNGLRDIQNHLGTTEYPRLRIGVGAPPEEGAIDHVLSRFRPSEWPVITEAVEQAAQAVAVWLHQGIEAAMNQYNPDKSKD